MEYLKLWFKKNQRDLPWRNCQNPYYVWVSEVMLQQTQVSVVLPYFQRWIEKFPTVEALATAPIEEVIKLWEGLGYYSRARNLHIGAQLIVQKFGGKIPSTGEQLLAIKGIGSYTKGAILSFAFHQKSAAVDGNVRRVIARYTGCEKTIEEQVEKLLPDEEPWVMMEAMIELGATICMKKPKCSLCPIQKQCYAYRHQLTEQLPSPKKRAETTLLKRSVAIIVCRGHYLLKKVEQGVMRDLFEFPYIDYSTNFKRAFEKQLQLSLTSIKPLKQEKHSFTRYRAELYPHLFETDQLCDKHLWKSKQELFKLPFSSGHRRILNYL